MTIALMLAGALFGQVATVPVSAQEISTDTPTITASARPHRSFGWFTSTGPDSAGQYRAWVRLADLDLTTQDGSAAMTERLERAVSLLCEMSADGPQFRGFHNRSERECLRDTDAQVARQVSGARAMARDGRPVAVLGLAGSR